MPVTLYLLRKLTLSRSFGFSLGILYFLSTFSLKHKRSKYLSILASKHGFINNHPINFRGHLLNFGHIDENFTEYAKNIIWVHRFVNYDFRYTDFHKNSQLLNSITWRFCYTDFHTYVSRCMGIMVQIYISPDLKYDCHWSIFM